MADYAIIFNPIAGGAEKAKNDIEFARKCLDDLNVSYKFYPTYKKLPKAWIIGTIGFFEFRALKFFIGFENILNHEYQLVYGYPMNGRTFHYGLRWEFWE